MRLGNTAYRARALISTTSQASRDLYIHRFHKPQHHPRPLTIHIHTSQTRIGTPTTLQTETLTEAPVRPKNGGRPPAPKNPKSSLPWKVRLSHARAHDNKQLPGTIANPIVPSGAVAYTYIPVTTRPEDLNLARCRWVASVPDPSIQDAPFGI